MPVLINDNTLSEKLSENLERKLLYLNNLMTAVIEFNNGPMENPEKPHSHPHEQITYVAEGEINVFIDNEKTHLKQGDLFAVPGGILHGIQTLTPYVKLIDTFTPLRQEFLQ
jgi:quercetin dioxygenase-like cupin family protein